MQRALLTNKVHAQLQSLRALKIIQDVPILRVEGEHKVSVKQGKQQVKLDLVNNFGELFQGAKTIKATLVQLDGSKGSKDVTSSLKFDKNNNQGTLTLSETEAGKFSINVTVDGNTVSTKFTVTDSIKIKSAKY